MALLSTSVFFCSISYTNDEKMIRYFFLFAFTRILMPKNEKLSFVIYKWKSLIFVNCNLKSF